MPHSPADINISELPNDPGVYWMKDRIGKVLYVGKAKNLKKRVSSYFQPGRYRTLMQPKVKAMIDLIANLEWLVVKSEAEALLLESQLIKDWKPKYNTDLTDDKHFLSVKVDIHSKWPQFRLVRSQLDDGAIYFGPFAQSHAIRNVLNQLKKNFGILTTDTTPTLLPNGLYRLYNDVRADLYGEWNEVSPTIYQERVKEACTFLKGKIKDYRENIHEKMQIASEAQAYEKAAQLRDQLLAIDQALSPVRRFKRKPSGLNDQYDEDGLIALTHALKCKNPIFTIEGFDISHISGTFTVASMVRFEGGKPQRSNYRRYKIQSFEGNDDFRAMTEVVERRYYRLYQEKKILPDLILIDGGLGQIRAALIAFEVHQWPIPFLIGLAKKEETIIFPNGQLLKLPRQHLGLQLLQRVRDEAHRFANKYSADLRSKKLKESIISDIPGLGPKKTQLLWTHFRDLKHLKAASIEELQAIPGIHLKLAQKIKAALI